MPPVLIISVRRPVNSSRPDAVDFDQVAGVEPAVAVERIGRRFGILEVAGREPAAHNHFAGSDVAGNRVGRAWTDEAVLPPIEECAVVGEAESTGSSYRAEKQTPWVSVLP